MLLNGRGIVEGGRVVIEFLGDGRRRGERMRMRIQLLRLLLKPIPRNRLFDSQAAMSKDEYTPFRSCLVSPVGPCRHHLHAWMKKEVTQRLCHCLCRGSGDAPKRHLRNPRHVVSLSQGRNSVLYLSSVLLRARLCSDHNLRFHKSSRSINRLSCRRHYRVMLRLSRTVVRKGRGKLK